MVEERVLVATDESVDGRHAVKTAMALTASPECHLTILKVIPVPAKGEIPAGRLVSTEAADGQPGVGAELDQFRSWLGPESLNGGRRSPEVAVAFGIPGIEIGRLADLRGVGLIVLGRRPRTPDHRLMLGETADAVVRRSDHPVLFVPPEVEQVRKIVVALDGTERAIRVLERAHALARGLNAKLQAVTVEPVIEDERGPAGPMPRGRTVRLGDAVGRLPKSQGEVRLEIRAGNPVDEVLAHCSETKPDLLVIGYRRGGPPKVIGPTDIARNLLYAAPCAVYTVPL
ncbi:MAG: universal stress protein [Gemmatimonadales bacterium]|nr:universal stress protein [Gemmatimonadales bacterium]